MGHEPESAVGFVFAGHGGYSDFHRLRNVPDYVLDSVLVHELTHTFIHDGHSADFWSWADKAPRAERAKGFLEAWGRMTVAEE